MERVHSNFSAEICVPIAREREKKLFDFPQSSKSKELAIQLGGFRLFYYNFFLGLTLVYTGVSYRYLMPGLWIIHVKP